MKIRPDDLDRLSKDDLKALVLRLLAEIEAWKDGVARLKGQPGRPKSSSLIRMMTSSPPSVNHSDRRMQGRG